MMGPTTFLVDGYGVGDRLLEGVEFECTVDPSLDPPKITSVKVVPEAEAYFSQLNEAEWIKAVEEDAQETIDQIMSGSATEADGTELSGLALLEAILADVTDENRYLEW